MVQRVHVSFFVGFFFGGEGERRGWGPFKKNEVIIPMISVQIGIKNSTNSFFFAVFNSFIPLKHAIMLL